MPNKIVLVATGLAGGQLLVRLLSEPAKQVLLGALWGALIGGGIFWVLFQISDGKWIGGGDVKLGAVLGAITGGPLKALLIIFIASLIGTVMTAPQTILKSVSRKTQIPFGPFLIIATIIVYLFGTSLIVWYKNQAGL